MSRPGRIVVGFVVLWFVLDGSARRLGSFRGEAGIAVAAFVVVAALLLEWFLFDVRPREAIRALGFGRPERRTMLVAAGLAAVLLAFYPLYALAAGVPIRLRPDALALAPGLFAQGGIAEETVFRGFLFRHVRAERPFWPAAFLSMLPFAAVHLPLFVTQGLAVAAASTLLALAISLPLAALFEAGAQTIWAPALIHFVVQGSIKMVDVPASAMMPMAVAWMAVCATVPYLVFARRILPMRHLPAAVTAAVPALAAVLLLTGCNPKAPGDDVTVTTETPAPSTSPGARAQETPAQPAGFVNRVWRVTMSDAVAPGTLYVFMAESTLVIDGPGGTPAVGRWRRDGDGLVMIEEGIAYPTDILELTGDSFRILSHNPGKAVEITMVPAEVTR